MAWLAEVFRRGNRVCGLCRMGPTHVLGADPALAPDISEEEAIPLCNGCLAARLSAALAKSQGRVLLFQPALGPGCLTFHSLADLAHPLWPADGVAAARDAIDRLRGTCDACEGAGARIIWVPSEREACLWDIDWLAALRDGSLAPAGSLCGGCAAGRLMRSIEERGLYFESITLPDATDGVILGTE